MSASQRAGSDAGVHLRVGEDSATDLTAEERQHLSKRIPSVALGSGLVSWAHAGVLMSSGSI
jgi:hypothetical protein